MTGCWRLQVWGIHRYVGIDGKAGEESRKLYKQRVGNKLAEAMSRRGGTWVLTGVSGVRESGRTT